MANFETVCGARPGSAAPKLSAEMNRPRSAALPRRAAPAAQSPRAVPPGLLSARSFLGRSQPALRARRARGGGGRGGKGGPRSAGRAARGVAAPGGGGGAAVPGRGTGTRLRGGQRFPAGGWTLEGDPRPCCGLYIYIRQQDRSSPLATGQAARERSGAERGWAGGRAPGAPSRAVQHRAARLLEPLPSRSKPGLQEPFTMPGRL